MPIAASSVQWSLKICLQLETKFLFLKNESQARPLTRLSEHLQKKLGEGCKNSTKRENHGQNMCGKIVQEGTRPARR